MSIPGTKRANYLDENLGALPSSFRQKNCRRSTPCCRPSRLRAIAIRRKACRRCGEPLALRPRQTDGSRWHWRLACQCLLLRVQNAATGGQAASATHLRVGDCRSGPASRETCFLLIAI